MVYINDVYKGLQTDCTGIGKPCIYVEFSVVMSVVINADTHSPLSVRNAHQ